jgi:HK97 family phage prohead protease
MTTKPPRPNGPEVRFASGTLSLELREGTQDPLAFIGKAIVCASRSKNLGGFVEVIDSKALDAADMTDVVGLFNHNKDILLGRTSSGTMQLTRDADGGLSYRIAYDPADPDHVRLMAKMNRGDVVGSSFAFTTTRNGDTWEEEETEGGGTLYVRTVTAIKKIYDVSPVTDPAYADTSAAKRSLEHFQEVHAPVPAGPDAETLRMAEEHAFFSTL